MSNHRVESSAEFQSLIREKGHVTKEQIRAVKTHVRVFHVGLSGLDNLAQVVSHQAALLRGEIQLEDLVPKNKRLNSN